MVLEKWLLCLDDYGWPYNRRVDILFGTKRGHTRERWIFNSHDEMWKQFMFWHLKFYQMLSEPGVEPKGKMPILWRDTSHEIIWC